MSPEEAAADPHVARAALRLGAFALGWLYQDPERAAAFAGWMAETLRRDGGTPEAYEQARRVQTLTAGNIGEAGAILTTLESWMGETST